MKTIIALISILICSNISVASEVLGQYFNFMGFTLEKSEISDVLQKMGETVIHKEGDAANSYTGVCYFYSKDKVTVFFESGEMGGGTILLSFKVMQNLESKYSCRTIKTSPTNFYAIGNLKLGNDLNQTINSLPKNIKSKDDLVFRYHMQIPFTKEEIVKTQVEDMKYAFWDQSVTIKLFAKLSKVTGYSNIKITSW